MRLAVVGGIVAPIGVADLICPVPILRRVTVVLFDTGLVPVERDVEIDPKNGMHGRDPGVIAPVVLLGGVRRFIPNRNDTIKERNFRTFALQSMKYSLQLRLLLRVEVFASNPWFC